MFGKWFKKDKKDEIYGKIKEKVISEVVAKL